MHEDSYSPGLAWAKSRGYRSKTVKAKEINNAIKLKNSSDVSIENAVYYQDEWGESPKIFAEK